MNPSTYRFKRSNGAVSEIQSLEELMFRLNPGVVSSEMDLQCNDQRIFSSFVRLNTTHEEPEAALEGKLHALVMLMWITTNTNSSGLLADYSHSRKFKIGGLLPLLNLTYKGQSDAYYTLGSDGKVLF
jgi:hypothetical protein